MRGLFLVVALLLSSVALGQAEYKGRIPLQSYEVAGLDAPSNNLRLTTKIRAFNDGYNLRVRIPRLNINMMTSYNSSTDTWSGTQVFGNYIGSVYCELAIGIVVALAEKNRIVFGFNEIIDCSDGKYLKAAYLGKLKRVFKK